MGTTPHHTPQQNGHVESFHKTLKKEYLWSHEFSNYQQAEIILADDLLITTIPAGSVIEF